MAPGVQEAVPQCCKRVVPGVLLAALAGTLQGCVLDIPRHMVGNWQSQENYLKKYAFDVPPDGANKSRVVVNSCAEPGLAAALQCSGHGSCQRWYDLPPIGATTPANDLRFCACDRDWAGPECNIQRKSQQTALLLSMFLGMFGVDQFYLGMIEMGIWKLLTLGGCGFWWIYDVVRIGSTPVPAMDSYRVAADVSHWAFVLTLLVFTGIVGFGLSVWSIGRHRTKLSQEIAVLRAEIPSSGSYGAMATGTPAHAFRGHGATLKGQVGGPYSTPMQRVGPGMSP